MSTSGDRSAQDLAEMLERSNAQVLDAVDRKDVKAQALVYHKWGETLISLNRIDEGCFFLTQSYVLALELGLGCADNIQQVLVSHGRDRD